MDANVIGPATLGITQTISAFQFFLPRLSDVRKSDAATDHDMVGDVRMGEVASFTLCLGIGAIVSSLTGSSVPIVVSLLMAVVLTALYESALNGNRPLNPPATNKVQLGGQNA
jgi:hypothetical protein